MGIACLLHVCYKNTFRHATIATTAGIHKFDRFMAFPESSPSSSSFDDGPEREQQAARLILQNASKTSFSTFNNEFTGLLLFVCARLTADAARLSLKKKKKKKKRDECKRNGQIQFVVAQMRAENFYTSAERQQKK